MPRSGRPSERPPAPAEGSRPAPRPAPRSALAALAALLLGVAGLVSAQAPDRYELPGEAVFPEGIAVSADGSRFFTGSTVDGTIFVGDVAGGGVSVLASGAQPAAVGMAVDAAGRLWVAGGRSGLVVVYDTGSGEVLARFETSEPGERVFVNDIAAAPDGSVYITDSFRPLLFRGAADLSGIETWLTFDDDSLRYQQGFNLNGIAADPSGETLYVVHSARGELYAIATADGAVRPIPVEARLNNGDGLLLDGDVLWVVRNSQGEIVPVTLGADGGTAGAPLTDPAMAFPTTIALVDGALLVVNSQFDRQSGTPELPFTVVRVALP